MSVAILVFLITAEDRTFLGKPLQSLLCIQVLVTEQCMVYGDIWQCMETYDSDNFCF